MKFYLTILLAGCLMLMGANAGTIVGKVNAEGKDGAGSSAEGGKYDSRAFKFAEKVNYAEMKDFVVYIDGPVGTNQIASTNKPMKVVTTEKVSQKKAEFKPHILPVMVGTTVEWPNNDEIYHNVFSYSEPKPFDLDLYKAPEIKRVTFDKAGRVDVFCSIHSTMSCVVLVLENPHFTTTRDKGDYRISDVPAGTYKLKAWHERLPSQIKEVTVPEKGEVKVDFTLGIKNLPKY